MTLSAGATAACGTVGCAAPAGGTGGESSGGDGDDTPATGPSCVCRVPCVPQPAVRTGHSGSTVAIELGISLMRL